MEQRLNPRARDIAISGIRQFFNRVSQYPDAVSLTIGQPDFLTPEHVKAAGERAIDKNHTTYTANAGLPSLRWAATRFVRRYGLDYRPDDEVIVTIGASQAIDIALRTLLEPGDEVILPAPVYPAYAPLIHIAGARPVYVDTRDTGFRLTPEALLASLTERTKCVILPYPSNPTGQVLTHTELAGLAEVLSSRDVFVVSDEIYSELVYDGPHVSIATFPGMRDKTVVVNGLAKSHAMTGWRIGFTFAPPYITQHMLKVHQYNVSCASSISQYAALEALTHGVEDAAPMRAEYRRRRDYVHDRLTAMGLGLQLPEGAFYAFTDIRSTGLASLEFAVRLLEEGGVAVVPGDAFSEYGEGFVRISYAAGMDVLTEGCDRIARFLTTLA